MADEQLDEVIAVARGIATAIAPASGITDTQAALLNAVTSALTGIEVDYHALEPLDADALGAVLAERPDQYRHRIVHHMVLGELVLRPLPPEVAFRVAQYAKALGVDDDFVRVARRYAQGAFGLAWVDLRRNGFIDHVQDAGAEELNRVQPNSSPFERTAPDPAIEARWLAYRELPDGTLGRCVWELYDSRGFAIPGSPGGASPYLAQHDFVHVLADYGTNLKGELEVFAFIGRADPDPKGFAWLATLIGLFETGYIADTGFFERDVRERNVQAPGMQHRVADAIRRGKSVAERCQTDLFDVDYHELSAVPLEDVGERLRVPPKSELACASGSASPFELDGMSEIQRTYAAQRAGAQTP